MPDDASARPLPQGTLTLLFTDIEGSTTLLRALGGDRYADVLSRQRRLLREAFGRRGGVEMGTEGDSFFVVFETAAAAVQAAVEAQQALASTSWPDGATVRVRTGIHTGEPQRHEDGYVGMDVHRGARIAASAHGGQVVVSEATHRLVQAALPDGVGAVDLGPHRLKDLPQPERLYQLTAPGLARDFPPLRSLGAGSSLPVATTSLVGRDGELAELTALLAGDDVRLLTLTGPGGSGKTRLALAVAERLEPSLADGVYFVPLETARNADVMWTTLAEQLGVAAEGGAADAVTRHLARARTLLVLDNLEQLDDAPKVVDQLLRAAPGCQVVATSRRPLHLDGEQEHEVPPLTLPTSGATSADQVASSGAVGLFVQRARLVRPGFALDDRIASDVAAICRRLDGLPLALELAAARVKLLSPAAIRARLDDGLPLSSSRRGGPSRQQTLSSTIAWSYDLLPLALQVAFRQLGAFDGSFTMDALAAVVGDPLGDPVDTALDPLDVLGELVDVSLVVVHEGPDGEPRARLLNTVAAFARDRLAEAGELDAARRRHARFYVEFAEHWGPQLRSEAFLTVRETLESELDNLRAALRWALRLEQPDRRPLPDDVELALRVCRQLSWFWYATVHQNEGRRWLSTAVEVADAVGGEESTELMVALHGLAVLMLQHGELQPAREAFERCLAHWRRTGDLSRVSMELNSLGVALRALGDPDGARDRLTEAAAVARQAGARERLANPLSNLATVESDLGRTDRAIELLREVYELDRELGDTWGQCVDQVNIGGMLVRAGRVDEARQQLAVHAGPAVELGDVDLTLDVVDLCCMVAATGGDPPRGARLAGASAALRRQHELPMPTPDRELVERRLAEVRDRLGAGEWDRLAAEGEHLALDDAVAEALAVLRPATASMDG